MRTVYCLQNSDAVLPQYLRVNTRIGYLCNKKLSASGGLRPADPLTRGSVPGPRWGHSPQPHTVPPVSTISCDPVGLEKKPVRRNSKLTNNTKPNYIEEYYMRFSWYHGMYRLR